MKVLTLIWVVFMAVGSTAVAVPGDKRSPVPQRGCDLNSCSQGCAFSGKSSNGCKSDGTCDCR
ncbi:hypothetical protein WAI453_006552 [Rhynchosporium graminicola]